MHGAVIIPTKRSTGQDIYQTQHPAQLEKDTNIYWGLQV